MIGPPAFGLSLAFPDAKKSRRPSASSLRLSIGSGLAPHALPPFLENSDEHDRNSSGDSLDVVFPESDQMMADSKSGDEDWEISEKQDIKHQATHLEGQKPSLCAFISTFQRDELMREVSDPKSMIESSAKEAIIFLKGIMDTSKDPVSKLNEYYQYRGITSLSFSYEAKEISHLIQGKRTKTVLEKYWRCTFSCPIDKNSPPVASQIPLALAYSAGTHTLENDDLSEIVLQMFGRFEMIDGTIFFATKKGAKKSVAVAILQRIKEPSSDVLVSSKNQASVALLQIPESKREEEKNSTTIKPGVTRYFPSWVHDLYAAGVRTPRITYCEHAQIPSMAWRGRPTDIRCTIASDKPIAGMAVHGRPFPNKTEARRDAVESFVREVRKHRSDLDDFNCSMEAVRKKQNLLNCDAKKCSFYNLPPNWATAQTKPSQSAFFLYELNITSPVNGSPFGCTMLGVDSDKCTRLGILFMSDIEAQSRQFSPMKPNYTASFSTSDNTGSLDFLATLCNRSKISLDQDSLNVVRYFNEVIAQPKIYGFTTNRLGPSQKKPTRSYLFVPLQTTTKTSEVDFGLLKDVFHHRSTPFLLEPQIFKIYPIVESSKLRIAIAGLLIAVSIALCWNPLETYFVEFFPVVALCLAIYCFLSFVSQPSELVPLDEIKKNFFVTHKVGKTRDVFVLTSYPRSRLTPNSTFKSPAALKCMKEDQKLKFMERHGLDVAKATFADFYRSRFNVVIRYTKERLIVAKKVEKHDKFNPLNRSPVNCSSENENQPAEHTTRLIPELVEILPMPRDALYSLSMASRFLPPLEREISLHSYSSVLNNMGRVTSKQFTPLSGTVSTSRFISLTKARVRATPLPRLIENATTLNPRVLYQRLEFLGDAVLGYFLALNVLAVNSNLMWDAEAINKVATTAAKNVALFQASLRLGIAKMIQAISPPLTMATPGPGTSENSTPMALHHTKEIAESTLSDVVESLLGAAYLNDLSEGNHKECWKVVALLELLELPIPDQDASPPGVKTWFKAHHPCLQAGYSFHKDEQWNKQLINIGVTIYCESNSFEMVQSRHRKLVEYLVSLAPSVRTIQDMLNKESSKIMMYAALSNSSLCEDEEAPVGTSGSPGERIWSGRISEKIKLLRESLYHLGSYSLQLMITDELYSLHPEATAGDLHLLRLCAFADDILAYVCLKSGIHECLMLSESKSIEKFSEIASDAELIGERIWARNEGWVLEGGRSEYQRRCHKYFASEERTEFLEPPKYSAVAGGRLFGNPAKAGSTGDLVTSFKSIVGALVLSLGTELTWHILSPIFFELLVLSANELRAVYKDHSPICKQSQSGNNGSKTKKLRHGVFG